MDFLEKDLENIIVENKETIHQRGFEVMLSNTIRQYKLPSGKIIDIVTYEQSDDEILLYIIELKRGNTKEALLQAYGYFAELYTEIKPMFNSIIPKIIIVGREITEVPIANYLTVPTECYTYTYDYNGIQFQLRKSNCDVPINDRKIKY